MRSASEIFFVVLTACVTLSMARVAGAQGSGPPEGMEALLWAFLAVAAVFVLVVSTFLYFAGKKVLFKDRKASRIEKVVLFAASIIMSLVVGLTIMLAFDLR